MSEVFSSLMETQLIRVDTIGSEVHVCTLEDICGGITQVDCTTIQDVIAGTPGKELSELIRSTFSCSLN